MKKNVPKARAIRIECFYSWRDSTADITTHTRGATDAGGIVGAQKAAKKGRRILLNAANIQLGATVRIECRLIMTTCDSWDYFA